METQNITLSIPKQILLKVRLIAVQWHASVPGLLTQTHQKLVKQEDACARARRRHRAWPQQGVDLGTDGHVTTRQDDFITGSENLRFIDTNILIYAHDTSAGQKHIRARDLMRELWQTGEGCLSVQVLQEFYVNSTQKVANPLPTGTAAQIIADLSVWKVDCPNVDGVLYAIRLQERYRIPFWDAMTVASAIRLGCRIMWSEDLSRLKSMTRLQCGVRSENPGAPANLTLTHDCLQWTR